MEEFPSARCWEILNVLLNQIKPITIDEIAEQLNVSNKTIRNDLKVLEKFLNNKKLGELIRKPRVGVWLNTTQQNRLLIRNIIDKEQMYIQPYSVEERKYYIIRRVLLCDKSITIQDIADELYVSKMTIYKDLEEVENWLKNYNLKVKRKQNYGLEVLGEEDNWRKAVAELLLILKKDKEIKNILSFDNKNNSSKRICSEHLKYLQNVLPNIDLIKIENILIEAETSLKFIFTDEAFMGLLTHIAISIERIRQNKDIKTYYKNLTLKKDQKEYKVSEWIAKRIEEEFNIKLPEPEIGYILLHIMGAKIQENFQEDDAKEILESVDDKVVELAKEMILMIGNVLSVDFSSDDKLLAGLVLHLRPAINRLKYGMTLRNPLLDEIKSKYSSIYGATWTASVLFEKFFGVKVTEEEIGYIVLHIGAALVRLNEKTRAIVVCSSGIGTAQLVAERLKKELPELEIVDITSVYALEKIKATDFDIILSTIPISTKKFKSKPLINISVFVNEKDIAHIKLYVKNVQNTRKFDGEVLNDKNNEYLYSEDMIFANEEFKTKEEVISFMCKALEEKGYVKEGFLESVFQREKISSTSVGEGVAIPHGNSNLIIKPVIAVMTLKEPIDWSGDKVDIIFLLSYYFDTGSKSRRFFKNFFSLLNNKKELDNIRKAKNYINLYNNLFGKEW